MRASGHNEKAAANPSICKMNMILHGITDADIQNYDTLAHPLPRKGAELMRFDRVISNPPFSRNYARDGMKFAGRFVHGFRAETGKADLLFARGRNTFRAPRHLGLAPFHQWPTLPFLV